MQTRGDHSAFLFLNKLVTVLIKDSSWSPDRPKWELFMLRYSPSLRSDVIYQLCCLLCNPHLCKCSLMPLFIFSFTLTIQASSYSSMLHFICFLQPCLAAVCFASCGLLVPTTPPSTIEWCHQVTITPNSNHLLSPSSCPSVCCFSLNLSTVDCLCVSAGRYDDGPAPRRPWDCF